MCECVYFCVCAGMCVAESLSSGGPSLPVKNQIQQMHELSRKEQEAPEGQRSKEGGCSH